MLIPTDNDLYSGWLLGMSPIIAAIHFKQWIGEGKSTENRRFFEAPKKTGSPVDLPFQWEFQDPKMEVLYHIRAYFLGIFPYIGLKNRPYIWNRYLQFLSVPESWPLTLWPRIPNSSVTGYAPTLDIAQLVSFPNHLFRKSKNLDAKKKVWTCWRQKEKSDSSFTRVAVNLLVYLWTWILMVSYAIISRGKPCQFLMQKTPPMILKNLRERMKSPSLILHATYFPDEFSMIPYWSLLKICMYDIPIESMNKTIYRNCHTSIYDYESMNIPTVLILMNLFMKSSTTLSSSARKIAGNSRNSCRKMYDVSSHV